MWVELDEASHPRTAVYFHGLRLGVEWQWAAEGGRCSRWRGVKEDRLRLGVVRRCRWWLWNNHTLVISDEPSDSSTACDIVQPPTNVSAAHDVFDGIVQLVCGAASSLGSRGVNLSKVQASQLIGHHDLFHPQHGELSQRYEHTWVLGWSDRDSIVIGTATHGREHCPGATVEC